MSDKYLIREGEKYSFFLWVDSPTIQEKYEILESLHDNWDDNNAVAISPDIIEIIKSIVSEVGIENDINIFPKKNGTVNVEYGNDNIFIEMEVFASGTINILLSVAYDNTNTYYEKLKRFKPRDIEFIKRFLKSIKNKDHMVMGLWDTYL